MFVNLAYSGIFWQIWGNLAEYARFCQILPDYQCEKEKNMFLSNMDPQRIQGEMRIREATQFHGANRPVAGSYSWETFFLMCGSSFCDVVMRMGAIINFHAIIMINSNQDSIKIIMLIQSIQYHHVRSNIFKLPSMCQPRNTWKEEVSERQLT